MTITLDLSPEQEARLRRQAVAHGQDPDEHAHELLVNGLDEETPRYDPAAALAALDSFLGQDEAEHRDTLAVLRRALDEDRPGQRRVFGEAVNPPAGDEG